MRLRTPHLACLVLLLSSLGVADASAPAGSLRFGSHYIAVLLCQKTAATRTEAPSPIHAFERAGFLSRLDLRGSERTAFRTPWSMRPAAAHSVSVHAVTGLAPRADASNFSAL